MPEKGYHNTQHNSFELHNAPLTFVLLSVNILNVAMLSVFMLRGIRLSVTLLNVVMLS